MYETDYYINQLMRNLEDKYQIEKEAIYPLNDSRYYYPNKSYYYPSKSWDLKYDYSYINNASQANLMTGSTPTKEIVPVNYKKFIIIGTSGAATHPTEHSTLEAAEKEAERLSGNKPGEEFTIFETKKSYKIEKPKPVVKTFV